MTLEHVATVKQYITSNLHVEIILKSVLIAITISTSTVPIILTALVVLHIHDMCG